MASITWNSNRWKGEPTEEDLASSKYDHVRDYAEAHESLNFAFDTLPTEKNDWFIGYSPILNRRLPKSEYNIQILFLISTDHQNGGTRYVVGVYGFPQFKFWFNRSPKLHPFYVKYDTGSFRSKVEDIVLFDNYLPINNLTVQHEGYLPEGKQISQQGWNYLHSDNVENLLGYALSFNPENTALKRLMNKLSLSTEPVKIETITEDFFSANADSLSGIGRLEAEMQNLTPNKKQRISTYIERGSIGKKVKKLTGYKCLVCQALGIENPKGFKKEKGGYYVETHHVEPVAKQSKGSLGITNLLTVCATHHRQFHYGRVTELAHAEDTFHFDFDGTRIAIPKIKIPKRGH